MSKTLPKFVGLREAARLYGTTPTTMKRWIVANDVPFCQPVSRLRIRLTDLVEILGEPENENFED